MDIFTLDVGTGTQDFLLFRNNENIRNCPKAILPSPTRIVAEKVRKASESGKNILLTGYTMGGGPCSRAIKEAARKVRVYAFEKPALTINDSLDEVRKDGVEVVRMRPDDTSLVEIRMGDVDLNLYSSFLSMFGIEIPEHVIIAVQDHGFSPDESNRKFRFRVFEKILRKRPYLDSFLYSRKNIPEFYNRMRAVAESIGDFERQHGVSLDLHVIDTVFPAVAGAIMDVKEFPAFVANFGNGHTIFAVVDRDGRIYSMMEHHTSILRKMNLEELVEKFTRGELTNEDVFQQGGHGAFIDEVVDVRDFVATGPNSSMSSFRTANPVGDVMVVGNAGMVKLLMGDEFFKLAGV